MTNVIKSTVLFMSIVMSQNIIAEQYEVPPSSRSGINVPYISDEAMEQCVILYNKGKWLKNELERTHVNNYDKVSVDNYNEKVQKHTRMTNSFNRNCAGKQSESAYKAAKKLNNQ